MSNTSELQNISLDPMPPHKRKILENAERMAADREKWISKNASYYEDDRRYLGFLVPEGSRVLDLGCGTGSLLASLKPLRGVGIDFSPAMIDFARQRHPDLEFTLGDIEDAATIGEIQGDFDFVIISDTIGMVEDIDAMLHNLHRLFSPSTRLIVAYFSPFWGPLLNLATRIGWRMPQPNVSFISSTDFHNIMDLSEFEVIRSEGRQLVPFKMFGLGRLINRFVAPLPLLRRLCLRTYLVGRSLQKLDCKDDSVSIIIPCRNERGNIERAIKEMHRFGSHQEILFIEGNSNDGTYEECIRVQESYKGSWDIKVLRQDGRGKGDAVRKGFESAECNLSLIHI